MAGRDADRGRREVYAAELMAFEGTDLEEVEPFEVVADFAHRVVAGGWWPAGPVHVRPARRDARTSTTRFAATNDASHATGPGATRGARRPVAEIRLAGSQSTRATAVHELAHVLAGSAAGHGPVFRRAHVDVATVAFGSERAGWLAGAYHMAGLALGGRAWSPPPTEATEGPGHAIAL